MDVCVERMLYSSSLCGSHPEIRGPRPGEKSLHGRTSLGLRWCASLAPRHPHDAGRRRRMRVRERAGVEDRLRNRAKERERVHVPVDPRLGRSRRVRPNVRRVAVRQVKGEEVNLLLVPAEDHPRFAEIGLRVPRRMLKRHVRLAASSTMLVHVVLHGRVPAGEAVLVSKTLENALRRVPLLATVILAITPPPLVDETGEPVELRAPHRNCAPAPRGTENRSILLTHSRELPKWRAAARSLIPSRQARRTLRYGSKVRVLPPSPGP